MTGFVAWTLHRKRAVTPAMLEVLQAQWAPFYMISTSLSGQLRARCRSGSGEPIIAWYPDELQREQAAGLRPAHRPLLVAEAA
jgi:hypothetical protein